MSRINERLLREVCHMVAALNPLSAYLLGLAERVEGDQRVAETEQQLRELQRHMGSDPRLVGTSLNALLLPAPDSGSLPQLRHARSCVTVARFINEASKHATDWDPQVSGDELLAALRQEGIEAPEKELRFSLHELHRVGLVRSHPDPNTEFGMIGPSPDFFWQTDSLFQAWDPRQDARDICRRFPDPEASFSPRQLDQELGWGARRLNSAVAFLIAHNLADDMEGMMDGDYLVHAVMLTTEASFFAEDEQ